MAHRHQAAVKLTIDIYCKQYAFCDGGKMINFYDCQCVCMTLILTQDQTSILSETSLNCILQTKPVLLPLVHRN